MGSVLSVGQGLMVQGSQRSGFRKNWDKANQNDMYASARRLKLLTRQWAGEAFPVYAPPNSTESQSACPRRRRPSPRKSDPGWRYAA